MARCGCSGASCACFITGGGGIDITGSGSSSSPYLITADLNLAVNDTSTVNLTLSGDGSDANPWRLQADATVTLDQLTDVSTAVATTGYVLARQGDGTFALVPPSTAPAGALSIGDGLTGDASAGNKLRVLLAPASGLVVGPTGLAVQGGGAWTTYTPVWTATTTNPTMGNGGAEGYYSLTGKQVMFSIEINVGSTTKRGVGSYRFTLPVPPATNRRQVAAANILRYGVVEYPGVAVISGGRIDHIDIATSTAGQYLSHSVPATLPTGSLISVTGCYEAA
jgi:hypothetical protein